MTTHTFELPDATLVYDVRGPLPTADGTPPLLMIGQPMDASGFAALASYVPERTVLTYDPRGLGRSTRRDGSVRNDPDQQADDLHRLLLALGVGPVDLFASSGGAVTALALVAGHQQDVGTLVAHEPPLLGMLPDADAAFAAERVVQQAYRDRGWGAGMATFIALTSTRGELTGQFGAAPVDPAAFGLPSDDDGRRDDPLLSSASDAVTAYRPDVPALLAATTDVVVAAGVESEGLLTWRTTSALAQSLGRAVVLFPGHHGGFGDLSRGGRPDVFAARLREVLAGAR